MVTRHWKHFLLKETHIFLDFVKSEGRVVKVCMKILVKKSVFSMKFLTSKSPSKLRKNLVIVRLWFFAWPKPTMWSRSLPNMMVISFIERAESVAEKLQ